MLYCVLLKEGMTCRLAADERIDVDAAKLLISEYKKLKGERGE